MTPATLVTEHDLRSCGFPSKFKQHTADLIGKERTDMIRQHVAEVGAFRAGREKQLDFLNKFRGSPFYGLMLEAVKRFLKRNLVSYFRNFPDRKALCALILLLLIFMLHFSLCCIFRDV